MGMTAVEGHDWIEQKASGHLAPALGDTFVAPGENFCFYPHNTFRAERNLLRKGLSSHAAVDF